MLTNSLAVTNTGVQNAAFLQPAQPYMTSPKTIKTLKIHPDAKLPKRAHRSDAGADLYSAETLTVLPGEMRLVDTGIGVQIPVGYGGFVLNRSSQRTNGVTSLGTGLIDSEFRGSIKVLIVNEGNNEYIINTDTRIGQLVIMPVELVEFEDIWNNTERGTGGFGSTGK